MISLSSGRLTHVRHLAKQPARRPLAASSAVLLALSLLAAAPAFAQTKADKEAAGSHFVKGIEFYKEGNYSAALAEFRAAYKAVPSWEVLFNIGLSERRLFKYGDAVRTLNQYLKEGGAKVPKDRREAVRKELEQIKELVAEVNIKVLGKGGTVTVDGEKLSSELLKEPLLLGPGKHIFRAEREGDDPDEKTLELVSATKLDVVLDPKPKAVIPGELLIVTVPPNAVVSLDGRVIGNAPVKQETGEGGHEITAELEGYQTARTEVVVTGGQKRKITLELEASVKKKPFKVPLAGLIVVAGGGVLMGIGGILSAQASGASRDVSQLFANGGQWDSRYAQIESAGQRAQGWSTALLVTGGIVVVAGAVISVVQILLGGSSDEGEEEAPAAEEAKFFIAPNSHGASFGWSGTW